MGKGIPAAIKQDEDDSNVMFIGNGEELIDPLDKSLRVLGPREVVQENPGAVESKALRPSKLPIDGSRVKRVSLPHLQFVNRGARDEVAADQLRLLPVPFIGMLNGPLLAGGGSA